MTTILVDLDGTITDPARGIIGAYRYALDRLGCAVPETAALTWVIGPPLRVALPKLIGPSGDVEAAVRLYREHYTSGGLENADVYDGMREALAELRRVGSQLLVCTAKPQPFAQQVLRHFGLADLFDGIYGPGLDGRMDDKAELMAHMIASEGITPTRAVMIGDRDNDVRAARANGVTSIGVLWGYGSRDELTAAGATVLCERPHDLPATVHRVSSRSSRRVQ